ncbi:MAG: IS21 family transposase [Patescibacteria group bacterium]
MVPDRKVRMLMAAIEKTGKLGMAAMRADMDRKTARKYRRAGRLPSEMRASHTWRTRPDPLVALWPKAEAMLAEAPELEAKALFEWLVERNPGAYQEGHLRTFQRRVQRWRALEGPSQEVYFPQEHLPGKKMETDFTNMNSLGITIRGVPFPHLLCHTVLPYSNWEWGKICHSESLLALRGGLQAALGRLGRIPEEHWTDHSTAATHEIPEGEGGQRGFNRGYLDLMGHFGMKPRTIQVGAPNENGDVESANGALKRRVKQHLLLRGHTDFDSVEEYAVFLEGVMEKADRLRKKRLEEELAVMKPLRVDLLPEYTEEESRVTSWSTIQVSRNTYSVPSRLIGSLVRARVYDDRIEVSSHGMQQMEMPRLRGEGKHAVNYRHVIRSLLRKPGAFRHYKYRADMFPTDSYRWAYDVLCEACSSERAADLEYLRILHHAAVTMETRVDAVLGDLRKSGVTPRWEVVLARAPVPRAEPPAMAPLRVDLAEYDCLLDRKEATA